MTEISLLRSARTGPVGREGDPGPASSDFGFQGSRLACGAAVARCVRVWLELPESITADGGGKDMRGNRRV